VVWCTVCSRVEVPGERKPVIRDDDDEADVILSRKAACLIHFCDQKQLLTAEEPRVGMYESPSRRNRSGADTNINYTKLQYL
jgi:hypothetical protein